MKKLLFALFTILNYSVYCQSEEVTIKIHDETTTSYAFELDEPCDVACNVSMGVLFLSPTDYINGYGIIISGPAKIGKHDLNSSVTIDINVTGNLSATAAELPPSLSDGYLEIITLEDGNVTGKVKGTTVIDNEKVKIDVEFSLAYLEF